MHDDFRTEYLPIDTTGAPLILQCPATGCGDLDLETVECNPGVSYMVTCGAGHFALIMKAPDEETP